MSRGPPSLSLSLLRPLLFDFEVFQAYAGLLGGREPSAADVDRNDVFQWIFGRVEILQLGLDPELATDLVAIAPV